MRFWFRSRRQAEEHPPAWADDRLGFWGVEDRGGSLGDYAGASSGEMLGVLARIELNEEDGRPLDDGLPPDALRKR